MQATILWYSGAAFGPRTPHFLVAKLEIFPQLISDEVSDCIPITYWICSHVFELVDLQLLENTQFFTPDWGFLLITLLLGMLYCLFLQGLTCAPNFVFSDIYLNLLFNFKVGYSLNFSCLMSSMFIIILIIPIIKTTCFDNTILMAELEGKLP